jgi:hypothetical protein
MKASHSARFGPLLRTSSSYLALAGLGDILTPTKFLVPGSTPFISFAFVLMSIVGAGLYHTPAGDIIVSITGRRLNYGEVPGQLCFLVCWARGKRTVLCFLFSNYERSDLSLLATGNGFRGGCRRSFNHCRGTLTRRLL